jgi:hypothetical protein
MDIPVVGSTSISNATVTSPDQIASLPKIQGQVVSVKGRTNIVFQLTNPVQVDAVEVNVTKGINVKITFQYVKYGGKPTIEDVSHS